MAIEVRAILGPRLPDVVDERCQPEHDVAGRRRVGRFQVVPVDVVGVPLVLLDPDALDQFRPDLGEQARLAHQLQPDRGLRSERQQLYQFVGHALRGHGPEQTRAPDHRLARGRTRSEREPCGKLACPQHAERVLFEGPRA